MMPRAAVLALLLALPAAAVPLAASDVLALPVDTGRGPEPYHTWQLLTADMALLAVAHPTLAKWSSLGKSVNGLDLWALEVTNFLSVQGDETVVYYDGGHHGNEQLGMEATYAVAVKLLNEWAINTTIQTIVEDTRIFLVPSINPDGLTANTRKNAHGVDLNRNYPWHWGEPGCSHSPSSATYCGPSALSEPEAKANAEFVERIQPDLYVSMHTGVTMFLHPWAYTTTAAPHATFYNGVAAQFRALTTITSGQASRTLYVASGTSMDWAYGATGALSWTLEVDGEQGGDMSQQDIERRLARPLRGLWWLLEHAGELRAGAALAAAGAWAGEDAAALPEATLPSTRWDVAPEEGVVPFAGS